MSALLYRWGQLAARRPWTVIGAWIVLSLLVVGAAASFGQPLEDSYDVPGLDAQQATDLMAASGSQRTGLTAQLVVTPIRAGATLESPPARAALSELTAAVAELPHVLGVSDPVAELGDTAGAGTGSVSADGRMAVVRIQYPPMDSLEAADLDNLKALVDTTRATSALRIEMGGDLFAAFEQAPTALGELLGILAAGVILLVAFGSVIAMGLPIGMALFGLALGTSAMGLITYLMAIPSWAPVVASMVGLGVGIDYSLFVVTRHREYLAQGLSVEESVGRSLATAGTSVIFAGGTVVIAILGLAVAGIPFLAAAGVAVAVIVLVMVLAAITLLPAFLGLAGPKVDGFSRRRLARAARKPLGRRWEHWGRHVCGHAGRYALGATVLLLALAAPVLSLNLGFADEGSLSESRTERRAFDLVSEGFGAGSNGPLVIAADLAGAPRAAAALAAAVGSDRGIASVTAAEVDQSSGLFTLVAVPTTAPQDPATRATIDRLRSEVFPRVLGSGAGGAHVGGQTALWTDIGVKVGDRLPWFIATVVLLSFLLLVVVFRSVAVPAKAAVMNLLSIAAAYGVLVMVFQWGWGRSLIGLEAPVPVVVFIPLFMFAILFGLSMDYEVFLLSRVREAYLRSGDNSSSIIEGIAGSARVITAAALIMISVFVGFVLGDDPVTKMFGLGLAVAIFLDATVVRLVLVPATMTLLGDANWWAPSWLSRVLPATTVSQPWARDELIAPSPLVEYSGAPK